MVRLLFQLKQKVRVIAKIHKLKLEVVFIRLGPFGLQFFPKSQTIPCWDFADLDESTYQEQVQALEHNWCRSNISARRLCRKIEDIYVIIFVFSLLGLTLSILSSLKIIRLTIRNDVKCDFFDVLLKLWDIEKLMKHLKD